MDKINHRLINLAVDFTKALHGELNRNTKCLKLEIHMWKNNTPKIGMWNGRHWINSPGGNIFFEPYELMIYLNKRNILFRKFS